MPASTSGNVERYVHSPMGVLAHEDNVGAWNWMLNDGLGSVRSVYDDSLAEVYSAEYAPYGDIWNSSGANPTPFQYTGQEMDSSGVQYHRARYYDPRIGAWLSLDPLETANRYAYVSGNVVNSTDLSGFIADQDINTLASVTGCNLDIDTDCSDEYYSVLKRIELQYFGRPYTPNPNQLFGQPPGKGHCDRLENCLLPEIIERIGEYSDIYFSNAVQGEPHPWWNFIWNTPQDRLDTHLKDIQFMWAMLQNVLIHHSSVGGDIPNNLDSIGRSECGDVPVSYYPLIWKCRWQPDSSTLLDSTLVGAGIFFDGPSALSCAKSFISSLDTEQHGNSIIDGLISCGGALVDVSTPLIAEIPAIAFSGAYIFLNAIKCGFEPA